jgi:Zn-finger nucleic acid-binding protein
MRSCPVCKVEMTRLVLKTGIEVELCPGCGGLWFDSDELEKVEHHDETVQAILQRRHINPSPLLCRKCGSFNPRQSKACGLCGEDIRLLCVSCQSSLEEVAIGNLVVDRCKKCRSVWLDAGELAVLFQEFQKVRSIQQDRKQPGRSQSGELLEAAGDVTLNTLIWAPELFFYSGAVLAEAAKHLPGLATRGVDGAVDLAGKLPDLAAGAANVSSEVLTGAVEVAGKVPEAAGALFDLLSDFIRGLFEALSD